MKPRWWRAVLSTRKTRKINEWILYNLKGSLRVMYPNTIIKGCLFHLGQCVWRKVQSTDGLREEYQHNQDFALDVRALLGIAFLPPGKVVEGLAIYMQHLNPAVHQLLVPVIRYFEDTYTGSYHHGIFIPPTFPPEMWTVNDRVAQLLPRTNNALEVWHHAFSGRIGIHHASLWTFISALQAEKGLSATLVILVIVHDQVVI